jgi:hypothetical protein
MLIHPKSRYAFTKWGGVWTSFVAGVLLFGELAKMSRHFKKYNWVDFAFVVIILIVGLSLAAYGRRWEKVFADWNPRS